MTMMQFQKALARRLEALRLEAGWTQEEVGRRAGLTRQHVQRHEAGSSNPKASTLVALAKTFGVAVHEMLEP
jgi:transcriptional regulator with XRE-family HTH domain